MATFTVTIVAGANTTSAPATFANADAQRILAGFRKFNNTPAATQQDLTDYLRKQALQEFNRWITSNEIVVTPPVPPVYSSS